MVKVAIVYHSESGHTEVIAQSITLGAKAAGAQVSLMSCDKADFNFLDNADAIIFGCPTYMGSVSGQFKLFMDATSEAWFQQRWRNKIAAAFTNSTALSGDKLSTLMQISLFAFQHGMIWVGLDLMPGNASEEELNRIGSWIGMMAQSKPGLDANSTPPVSDRKTAEYFGKRVTLIAEKFVTRSD
jgi:multimeric flavodoxin WrbA